MSKAKKRVIPIAAVITVMAALLFVMPFIKVSATIGSGTAADPYQISTAKDLALMAQNVNAGDADYVSAYYILTNNIDLSGSEWTPIGTETNPFKGTFDGKDHTVSGIKISKWDDDHGLFGYSYSATIKNVGVIDAYIEGFKNVGGICGYSKYDAKSPKTSIENCYFTGEISGTGGVGGICGDGYVTIDNCYNLGEVSGNGEIGGICGSSSLNSSIQNCHNTGKVSGMLSDIGGICGRSMGEIKKCYNTGVISGREYNVGGICGSDGSEGSIKSIEGCYNTGSVSGGKEYVGGICGYSSNSQCDQSVKNCYNTGKISGTDYVGGICGKAVSIEVSFNVGEVIGSGSNSGGVCGICDESHGSITNSYYTADSVKNGNGFGTGITISDFCNNLPSCFDRSIWTAGSAETVSSSGGVKSMVYHLPYLGAFGSSSQQDIKGYYDDTGAEVSFMPIYTAQQLQNINSDLSGTYKLMNDIDLSSLPLTAAGNWTAIGTEADPFKGTFDGNGKTISGLKINKPAADDQGLFGYNNGVIKNVVLSNVNIIGKTNVGGICGYNFKEKIGTSDIGIISGCYVSGSVSGDTNVGGICGCSSVGKILLCCNKGSISGKTYIGGICGYNTLHIENCYNIGSVSGSGYCGGICGNSNVTVKACLSLGRVSSSGNVIKDTHGNICGEGSADKSCYYNKNFYFRGESGTGLTPAELSSSLPAGLDSAYWTAGSSNTVPDSTNSNIRSEENELPYLTMFGSENQISISQYSYNKGTDSNPDWVECRKISTAEDLDAIRNNPQAVYILMNDITLSGEWEPISEFSGMLDGNYHTIKGLTISTAESLNSFIQKINIGGIVKRLGLANVNIIGDVRVGGICSRNYGTISECYVTGKIQGKESVGGICGNVTMGGKVESCYSAADLTETTDFLFGAGGICAYSDGTVRNCFSTGTISGIRSVGGICGKKRAGGNPPVENCYSAAKLVGGTEGNVGGICGYNGDDGGKFTNCYYDTDVIKVSNKYGTGITTAELCSGSLPNGFDSSIWTAGSSENIQSEDGIMGTQRFTLPYLTFLDNFDKSSSGLKQPELTVPVYKNGNDWVSCTPIYTAQELQDINKNLSGAYVLMNDINVSSLPSTSEGNWTSIGTNDDPFTGIFDGNGHTVSGIKINKPTDNANHQGLFGVIENAVIKNVGVINADIKGYSGAGGVCGRGVSGSIENCYFSGKVSGNDALGGICGYGFVSILNCYNLGEVSGSSNVGGITGMLYPKNNNSTLLSNCHNAGTISASGGSAGGIIGSSSVDIDNCYNTGMISAVDGSAGGICGYATTPGRTIQNCYNTGKVSVTSNNEYYLADCAAGGICGFSNSSVENCYNIGEVSGTDGTATGGVCGNNAAVTNSYYNSDIIKTDNGVGTGKTTLEMTVPEFAAMLGSEWTNKDNIKGSSGGTAFYPALTVFEDKAPSVKYTTKREISLKGDKSGFVISTLVKFDGMSDFAADDPALTSGKGTYSIRANGSEVAGGDIFDNTEVTVDHAIIPAERCVYTLVYDGTDSYFFPTGSTTAEMHNYGSEWSYDENGHWHVCRDCSRSGESEPHTYDEGVVTVEPTEETEGERTYTCTVCGQQRTEPIAPLSHTHIMNDGYSSDETGHWLTCAKCDEKIDFASHISDGGIVTKEPTAAEDGEKTYSCTICGYVIRTEVLPASGEPDEPIEPVQPSYYPSYISLEEFLSIPRAVFKDKLEAEYETDGSTLTISWDAIDGAGKYIVYQQIDGKYKPIKYTNDTSVTLKKLKNDTTYKFIIKYTKDGSISPINYSSRLTVKMYYKPTVTAEADRTSITLAWRSVPNAEKYAVYKYENGRAAKLSETDKAIVRITGLKPDTEYSYVVSAYVDGKWTVMTKGDVVTIRTLA